MSIIYWSQKKAPLKPEEVDGNFEYLEKKISALQELLKETPSLTMIEVKNGHLLCQGSDGTPLSPIKLPSWTPRGQWNKEASYVPGDIVYDEKCLYLCQGQGVTTRPTPGVHWTLVFSLSET